METKNASYEEQSFSIVIDSILKAHHLEDCLRGDEIIQIIHPLDEMNVPGNEEHYFSQGIDAIRNISLALRSAGLSKESITKILDFPCGYGRVMRFLKSYFPNATLYGSEIDSTHLSFCKETFGAKIFLSKVNFNEIETINRYDLVWVGSLFTHLSKVKFEELFIFLTKQISENGILVFTTHGRYCYNKVQYGSLRRYVINAGYLLTGYGYMHQHSTNVYGDSLISPSWLLNFIEKKTSFKVVYFAEEGWGGYQDVIAVRRRN